MHRLLACLLAALLIACGGDDNEAPEATPTPSAPEAAQILLDATTAAANLSTFHFTLTQERAIIPLPPNLDLRSAEGDMELPDRLQAELESEIQGVSIRVEAIAIGSDTWITNPFTRQWQQLNVDLREFANLGALLPALLPSIQEPRLAGTATLDGVQVHRIEGTANSSDLKEALPFALPDREVQIEIWLGVDDLLPRRVRVVGPLIGDESQDAVRQIDLSRLNQPVEIDPP